MMNYCVLFFFIVLVLGIKVNYGFGFEIGYFISKMYLFYVGVVIWFWFDCRIRIWKIIEVDNKDLMYLYFK